MGYYADFEINISDFKDLDEVSAFFKEQFEEENGTFTEFCVDKDYITLEDKFIDFAIQDTKWNQYEEELTNLSKKYPHILIEVSCFNLEESDDVWKGRWKNGESEYVIAYYTYPDFKKITKNNVEIPDKDSMLADLRAALAAISNGGPGLETVKEIRNYADAVVHMV